MRQGHWRVQQACCVFIRVVQRHAACSPTCSSPPGKNPGACADAQRHSDELIEQAHSVRRRPVQRKSLGNMCKRCDAMSAFATRPAPSHLHRAPFPPSACFNCVSLSCSHAPVLGDCQQATAPCLRAAHLPWNLMVRCSSTCANELCDAGASARTDTNSPFHMSLVPHASPLLFKPSRMAWPSACPSLGQHGSLRMVMVLVARQQLSFRCSMHLPPGASTCM